MRNWYGSHEEVSKDSRCLHSAGQHKDRGPSQEELDGWPLPAEHREEREREKYWDPMHLEAFRSLAYEM